MSNLGTALLIPARNANPAPPLPTVANLALWYDATKITALSDGMAVAQWDDLSGSANHMVQAVGANQPLFRTGIQNGRPGVFFDATNDNLQTTSTVTINVPGITVFAVARSALASGTIIENVTNFISPNGFLVNRSGSADKVGANLGGAVGISSADSGATTISVTRCLSVVFDKSLASGEAKIYSNGVDVTVVGTDSNNLDNVLVTPAKIQIGSRGGATGFLNGYIHEVLLYLRALPTNERQLIEGYLRTKWRAT